MLFCTCMQVRNNMRTSNLLRFPCTSSHKITALYHHHDRTQKLDGPDSRVYPSPPKLAWAHSVSLSLNKTDRAIEREEKGRKVIERERKRRGERNKEECSHITWPPCPWGTTTITNRRRRLYTRRNRRSVSRNPKFLAGAPIWRPIRYFRSLHSSRTLGMILLFPRSGFEWFPTCWSSDRSRFASEAPASLEFRPIYRFSVLAGENIRRRRWSERFNRFLRE